MRFLKRAAARSGKSVISLEDDAVAALMRYNWPGNIRELENVIERAVVLADGSSVTVNDLPSDLQTGSRTVTRTPSMARVSAAQDADNDRVVAAPETAWRRMDEDEERDMLLAALAKSKGNKARAARLLGLPRSTFFSKLKKFAIAE
jgi:transcriptional regulator of acetoin/glycerol metabolism